MPAKTQTIAGCEITLEEGRWYRASRPIAMPQALDDQVFLVTIWGSDDNAVQVVEGLDYDQANEFINAFNSGMPDFGGRNW